MRTLAITGTITASLLLAASLTGCKPRENGVAFSPVQSKSVDPTWLTASKACWPDLAHTGLTNEALIRNLSDPLHFRNTFSTYAFLSDDQILAVLPHSLLDAPAPNHTPLVQARTPVLTRAQAAAGAAPPASAPIGALPDDAFCALQSGTPLGFK